MIAGTSEDILNTRIRREERSADAQDRRIAWLLNRLLECPFCDTEELQIHHRWIHGDDGYRVICCDCGAVGAEGEDPDDAATAWNRRGSKKPGPNIRQLPALPRRAA